MSAPHHTPTHPRYPPPSRLTHLFYVLFKEISDGRALLEDVLGKVAPARVPQFEVRHELQQTDDIHTHSHARGNRIRHICYAFSHT